MRKELEVVKVINHLPADLCAPFIQWMLNGGHEPNRKKGCVTLKRGQNVAKIFHGEDVEPSYEMNAYCVERFELFSRQYFKVGKSLIDSLKSQAVITLIDARREFNISYLRVA